MSGQPKQGIDYSGWSVDIFDGDEKIDKLMDAQGCPGFVIYFYLCQMAYKHNGYFYKWSYDNAATTARRVGGGVCSETVKNTVGLCLQIGLFDKPLFDRDGILTSRGIQRRYVSATEKRRCKAVIDRYWLLNDEESRGFDKCAKNDENLSANDHSSYANYYLQSADGHKSKVKESKVKKNNIPADKPPDSYFDAFWKAYPKKVGKAYAEKCFKKVKVPLSTLLAAIDKQKKSDQWKKDGGQFIPNPATWLNRGQWDDDLEIVAEEEAEYTESGDDLELLRRSLGLS